MKPDFIFKFFFVMAIAVILSSCSAYIKESSDPATTKTNDGFSRQIKPQQSTSPAVLALIKKARTNAMNGDISKAMLRLERAVRIEPRNATVWHYMAKLFLQQENYKQAAGYAAKSINLTHNNKPLIIDNWRIIAHARYRLGNIKGAQKAQDRLNTLQQKN